jgi:hypothetical protein
MPSFGKNGDEALGSMIGNLLTSSVTSWYHSTKILPYMVLGQSEC